MAPLMGVVEAVVVGHDLGEGDELLGGAETSRPILGTRAQPPSTILHPRTNQLLHLSDLGLGGRPLVVVTHHQAPDRSVPYHGNHVHGHPGSPVRLHLVGDGPPYVSAIRAEHHRRDALHDQVVRPTPLHIVRGECTIRVGVHVDEAGDHVEARRVDHPSSGSVRQVSHAHDLVAPNAHVGVERRVARAIQHSPTADHDVEVLRHARCREEGPKKGPEEDSDDQPGG